MQDSIFTKIISGALPCHKIYEDEHTLAFLDIHPIQPGHVLVVPKTQIGFVWELPAEQYQALMATVRLVGKRLQTHFADKARVGVIIEGLDVVDHAHVKVFPFNNDAEFRNRPATDTEPDHDALAKLAAELAF